MLFSCYKVARIIAFVQCLQADIAPFIIHAENKEEYEGRLDSPARLEQLFRVELNNPVPVSLLSGDRKPQIRFLGNHHSGNGNLYHKSFRM